MEGETQVWCPLRGQAALWAPVICYERRRTLEQATIISILELRKLRPRKELKLALWVSGRTGKRTLGLGTPELCHFFSSRQFVALMMGEIALKKNNFICHGAGVPAPQPCCEVQGVLLMVRQAWGRWHSSPGHVILPSQCPQQSICGVQVCSTHFWAQAVDSCLPPPTKGVCHSSSIPLNLLHPPHAFGGGMSALLCLLSTLLEVRLREIFVGSWPQWTI